MKTTLRLPTKDQYAYIELELEDMTVPQAVEAYESAMALLKPQEGITDKDFNAFLDRQIMGEANHVEEYNRMSDEQKKIVQTIKRTLKRIEARQDN